MAKNTNNSRGWIFYAVVTVLFVAFLFVKRGNVVRWVQAGITIASQEKLIEGYNRSIEEMDRQLKGLDTSLDTLETYAREKFFFSAPGEDVYLTED